MDFDIKPLKENERIYAYPQSTQIQAQTGCMGYLKIYIDASGDKFISDWTECRKYLNTDEFKKECDKVINTLRFESGVQNILKNKLSLLEYCNNNSEASFNDNYNYGFRIDTEKYSYIIRVSAEDPVYQFYCYCYMKDWLNQQIKNSASGIKFINSNYHLLFKLKDGSVIKLKYSDGTEKDELVRYIDNYHFELGYTNSNIYHICEFAEKCEKNNIDIGYDISDCI